MQVLSIILIVRSHTIFWTHKQDFTITHSWTVFRTKSVHSSTVSQSLTQVFGARCGWGLRKTWIWVRQDGAYIAYHTAPPVGFSGAAPCWIFTLMKQRLSLVSHQVRSSMATKWVWIIIQLSELLGFQNCRLRAVNHLLDHYFYESSLTWINYR